MGRPVTPHGRARIRAAIDRIDRHLLRLLSHRWQLVDAMTRAKTHPDEAHDPVRSREILDRISRRAAQSDLPVDVAVRIWSLLLGLSVAHQRNRLIAGFSNAWPDEESPSHLRDQTPVRPRAGE